MGDELLIRLDENIKMIKGDLSDMKEERNRAKDVFWSQMKEISETLRVVREDHVRCQTHTEAQIVALHQKIREKNKITAIISGAAGGAVVTIKLLYDYIARGGK